MAIRRTYLVRHGEYDWNNDPRPSKGLTPLGVRQARLTAQRLRSVAATAIYSSDLMRAVETAQIIAAEHDDVPCRKQKILRECYLPSPAFANAPSEVIQAGKEQAEAAFARFLSPTRLKDKTEIIVSHGNLIRYMVSRVFGEGLLENWFRMRTLNCGITEIIVEPDERRWLVTYNDVGHLPADMITAGVPQRS